jgi:hypothetical protein
MQIKTSSLNRQIHIATLHHKGQYVCHITYRKGVILDYIQMSLDWAKAVITASTVLVGAVCWFFFAITLIGCSDAPMDPNEQDYRLPSICAKNDSTVKVFAKTYKVGKTSRATVYIDEDGALWLRWPDGTQKSYDEGQVFGCSEPDSLYF